MLNKSNPVVGIQGARGSYHDIVARRYFGVGAKLFYAKSFHELFKSLGRGEIVSAIAAVANNRKGPISETNQALLTGKYWVVGEGYLSVKHQLLGVPGATIADIKEIHTQDHAREQCSEFLHSQILPKDILQVDQEDTARSAELVAKLADPSKAAIASKEAGDVYGLEVLKADIQDDPDNITRFLQLELHDHHLANRDDDKATILLTTGQQPGALVDALRPLKDNDIDISTLHSSYVPNSAFEMRFILEVNCGLLDDGLVSAITKMVSNGCTVVPIGSFKRAIIPHESSSTYDN